MLTTGAAWVPHTKLDGLSRAYTWQSYLIINRLLRSGLVAYHILQSGVSCRLPKTPRSKILDSYHPLSNAD